ncbi:hypothetical protein [Pseudooceanicola sp.]|uniref:hypothetical protein n=1 Tax=Pseudooceanicola sp. TaxID=1914328 RepID=UPI0035C6E57E
MIHYLEETYARSQRRGPGPTLVVLTIGTAISSVLLFCAVMLILRLAAYFAPIDPAALLPGGF